jgi:hypothetical protein
MMMSLCTFQTNAHIIIYDIYTGIQTSNRQDNALDIELHSFATEYSFKMFKEQDEFVKARNGGSLPSHLNSFLPMSENSDVKRWNCINACRGQAMKHNELQTCLSVSKKQLRFISISLSRLLSLSFALCYSLFSVVLFLNFCMFIVPMSCNMLHFSLILSLSLMHTLTPQVCETEHVIAKEKEKGNT